MIAEISNSIEKAISLLKAGELVAIPTETVYGLAANALDVSAVTSIFKAKNRPFFDPLIVHIGKKEDLQFYSLSVHPVLQQLIDIYWPGPLTILVPKSDLIPDLVTSGLANVGIRMPAHPLTSSLLQKLPFPLAAPSANPFGYVSPTSAQHVFDQLGSSIPLILDGGECGVGVESTVVGMDGDVCVIYRLGGITFEQIQQVAPNALMHLNESSDPRSPGMLKSHYAPNKQLLFVDEITLSNLTIQPNSVLLCLKKPANWNHAVYELSATENLTEATQNLFKGLRELDASSYETIIALKVPDVGLGRAINDRLKRSAAF